MCTNIFRKSCRLCDNVEKYGGAREVADGNMAHARYMLDKKATRAQAHASVRAPAHTHTRARARALTHSCTHAHLT